MTHEDPAVKTATKLAGALYMVSLNGGNVQDMLSIINTALDEYHAMMAAIPPQMATIDHWEGII